MAAPVSVFFTVGNIRFSRCAELPRTFVALSNAVKTGTSACFCFVQEGDTLKIILKLKCTKNKFQNLKADLICKLSCLASASTFFLSVNTPIRVRVKKEKSIKSKK